MQKARIKKEKEERKLEILEKKINAYWDNIIDQTKLEIPRLSQESLDYFGELYGKSIVRLFTLSPSEVAENIKGLNENGVKVLKMRVYDNLLKEEGMQRTNYIKRTFISQSLYSLF